MEREKTTFTFACFEDESARLKIRLKHDKLPQTTFFASLLRMYIGEDPVLDPVVQKIKKDKTSLGKRLIGLSQKDREAGTQTLEDLGITESDRSDLFDVIELGKGDYE